MIGGFNKTNYYDRITTQDIMTELQHKILDIKFQLSDLNKSLRDLNIEIMVLNNELDDLELELKETHTN